MDDLDQLVHGAIYVPSIAVIGTERLKAQILAKHKLSLVELLSPFGGQYTPLSFSVRVLDQTRQIEGFKVRFVDPARCAESEKPGSAVFPKWFAQFCTHSIEASSADCLAQPIGTVLMVGSDDPNPVESFEQLSHVSNQSLLCRQGVLDPTSVRIKILVHDMARPLMSAESTLGQLRAMYSPNSVIFLPIAGTEDQQVSSLLGEQCHISWDDVARLNAAVECVVRENCVPWMERKVSQLDANIAAKRKGIRNQLKIFMRPVPVVAASNDLHLTQVEWQCRLAGDLAFFLRFYDLAFGYYRSVASELKTDKHFSQSAGCYEMSAITGFLGNAGSIADLTRYADQAFTLYKEARMDGCAVRSAVMQSVILRGRVEAGEKLIAANGEIPDNGLRCAMLLARAAELHAQAGLRRKAAFTTVLAGHMFNKVDGMKETALECYRSVLPLYRWNFITDHLLFTMAKLEFGLGHYSTSLTLISDLLRDNIKNGSGTPDKHANYIKLLGYIGKADSDLPPFAGLPIATLEAVRDSEVNLVLNNPLLAAIEVSSVKLLFKDETTESEVSGPITLAPLESRELALQVVGEGAVAGVEWYLSSALVCQSLTY